MPRSQCVERTSDSSSARAVHDAGTVRVLQVWAIGCVAYELFAGAAPFSAPELAYKVLNKRPSGRLPPTCSASMASIIGSMLEKDPAKRPSTSDLLRSAAFGEYVQQWMEAAFTPVDQF